MDEVLAPAELGLAEPGPETRTDRPWAPIWRRTHRIVPGPERQLGWLVGLAALALAGFGTAANSILPILSFPLGAPGARVVTWTDLMGAGSAPYESRLLAWPIVAYSLAAAAGALAVSRAYLVATCRWMSALQLAALGLAGYAGFLLALTGTRWLGFYIARSMHDGPSLVALHAVPYVNLGVGLCLLAGAAIVGAGRARRILASSAAGRWPLLSILLAGVGLVTMPLVPFGRTRLWGGVPFYLDEFTLAILMETEPWAHLGAPHALAGARLATWGILYASIGSLLFSGVAANYPLPRWIRRVPIVGLLTGSLVVAGLAFAVRFYERLPHFRENTEATLNPFLPLTVLGLAFLWLWSTFSRLLRRPA